MFCFYVSVYTCMHTHLHTYVYVKLEMQINMDKQAHIYTFESIIQSMWKI